MAFDLHIGSSINLELRYAILLYGSRGGHHDGPTAYATIHDIEICDGKPQITAGSPIARDAAIGTFRALTNTSDELTYLPARLIAHNMRFTCWYRPSQPATMWFEPKVEELAPFSGHKFHQPGLIFFATDQNLVVQAYIGTQRPSP